MPFAGYPDFAACVADQMKKGKKKENANRICGFLEQRHKEAHSSVIDQSEYKETVIYYE